MFETTSVGLKQSLGKILFHWELKKRFETIGFFIIFFKLHGKQRFQMRR
jgi:hypothetical protein